MIDLETVLEAHRLIAQDGVSLAEAARRLDVSRATLGRAIRRVE
ncbi:helix-turn-helix domain-containing protein [Pontivivens ytuae]|uniref:Helix-turn-helix domain-containing protein n=1 Tax=Pontivivens ytuae TaxID=2789856 RepID=A0A7S9QDY8_9RHOB|nr:helix-turn-helix domain-containing protein [Pontivivens ytuae]QPH54666.1 helix-turn-helix domain-containing protein [Pontivivens ytuae]